MTENKKEFLRKTQFLLLMACAVNPLPLLLYVGLTPALLPFAWAMPLAYLLLALLAFKIPGKFRLLYGIGGCAVLVALGVGLMALLGQSGRPRPVCRRADGKSARGRLDRRQGDPALLVLCRIHPPCRRVCF